jgi:hypothetical protein
MLASLLINIEPSESLSAAAPVQNRQQLVRKDTQSKKLVIPKEKVDTNFSRVLKQIDQRDKKEAFRKALKKKELEAQKSLPDSTWNIYTGNPGLYNTEGDTINFGNVQYLSDSLFLKKNQTVVIEKSNMPYGIAGKILQPYNQEWLLGIILIIWIIFASVRTGFSNYIRQLMGALVNGGISNRLYHEHGYKTLYGSVRLDIIFHMILPLAAFQILHFYGANLFGYHDILFYIALFIGINGYLFIKFFLYRMFGAILMLSDKINESLYYMRMYYKALGIVLLPMVTLFAVQDKIAEILVWIIAGTIALFYSASLFRSIYIGKSRGISIFYLILYFCMLEIFPLILLFKILAG